MSRTDKTYAQLLGERGPRDRVGLRNRRRNQQGDRSQEEQARLHAGADAVVFLDMIFESAEEKGRAQHEQRVGDDRAGEGRLHQHILPGAQGGERNDQFRQIPQRGIEQATDRIPGLGRHGFGGVTEQGGQRHDGQDGQYEEQRVRVVLECFGREHHGHEDQQPEQFVVLDFFEQWLHGSVLFGADLADEKFADDGEEKSSGQSAHQDAGQSLHRADSRHSFGSTRSP